MARACAGLWALLKGGWCRRLVWMVTPAAAVVLGVAAAVVMLGGFSSADARGRNTGVTTRGLTPSSTGASVFRVQADSRGRPVLVRYRPVPPAVAGRRAVRLADRVLGAVSRCGVAHHGFQLCNSRTALGLPRGVWRSFSNAGYVLGTRLTFTLALRSATGVEFALARRTDGTIVRDCRPVRIGGCGPRGAW